MRTVAATENSRKLAFMEFQHLHTYFFIAVLLLLNPTHHLQHLGGDHLHAAHGCGQRAHDGGDDVEGTNTKQQLLNEVGEKEQKRRE